MSTNTLTSHVSCTKCFAEHESIPLPVVIKGKVIPGECGKCNCHTGAEDVTYVPSVYTYPNGVTKTYYNERRCNNRCRNRVFKQASVTTHELSSRPLNVTNNYDDTKQAPEHGSEVWLEGYRSKCIGQLPNGDPKFIRIKVRIRDTGSKYLVREYKEKRWVDVPADFNVGNALAKGTWMKVSIIKG
jgi:hypothetical protein